MAALLARRTALPLGRKAFCAIALLSMIHGRRLNRSEIELRVQLVGNSVLADEAAKASKTREEPLSLGDQSQTTQSFTDGFWSLPMTALVIALPVASLLCALLTCLRLTPLAFYRKQKDQGLQAREHEKKSAESPEAEQVQHQNQQQPGEEEDVPQVADLIGSMLSLSLPVVVGSFLAMSSELINLVFMGHVGTATEIAAVGLGNTMQNCVGIYTGIGLIAALDTLVSQAVGSGRLDLAITYLQRARAIVFSCLIWMCPILWFSEDILLAIHENPEVAYNASLYNRANCFYLPLFFYAYSNVAWLRNLGYVAFLTPLTLFGMILQLPVAGFFILYLRWGNLGAGLANLTTGAIGVITTSSYLAYVGRERGFDLKSLFGFSREAFTGWYEYLRVGIPATLQTVCEMWYFEVIMLLSGYLGQTMMAAYVSSISWLGMLSMLGSSMGFVAAIMVGQATGSGKPLAAKMTTVLALMLTVGVALTLALFNFFGRFLLADLYTSNAEVEGIFANLCLLIVAFVIPDSCQMMMGGALRGLNRSTFVAMTFVISYWMIALPTAIVMAFRLGYGVHGLVFGNLIGTTFSCLIFGAALMRTDFEQLVKDAQFRMDNEEVKVAAS